MNKIEVGRLVQYFAGYGGIDGVGAIVAVRGTPQEQPPQAIAGLIVPAGNCEVDVILDDGRELKGIHQAIIDKCGIGIKLLEGKLDSVEHMFVLAARYQANCAIERAKQRAAFEAGEAARVVTDPPVFFWNGIKDQRGAKLQGAHYSMGTLKSYPEGTITIYARDYAGFSAKVHACFAVENDTDSQVDYFAKDTIRMIPQHPLYAAVKAACDQQAARWDARRAKKSA